MKKRGLILLLVIGIAFIYAIWSMYQELVFRSFTDVPTEVLDNMRKGVENRDISSKSQDSEETLLDVARKGDLERLKELISSGGLGIENDGGVLLDNLIVPFSVAPFGPQFNNVNKEVVVELIKAGAMVNTDNELIICYAIEKGDLELMEKLINSGLDVNHRIGTLKYDEQRLVYSDMNLVEIATYMGEIDALKYLITKGVDVKGESLFIAANIGNLEVTRELIKAGADVNAVDRGGRTPLMAGAAGLNRSEVKKELINVGAVLKGDMSSYFGIYNGPDFEEHLEVVRELIKAGADVNAVDKKGNSVLSYY